MDISAVTRLGNRRESEKLGRTENSMTIKKMNEIIIETGGVPFQEPTCIKCEKRKAEIAYSMGQTEPQGYLPYCVPCCEELAYGMLRDVQALIVGEDLAFEHYRELLKRLER